MTKEQAHELLKRYRFGLCNQKEISAIEAWIEEELTLGNGIGDSISRVELGLTLKAKIDAQLARNDVKKTIKLWPKISIAAAILLVGFGLIYFAKQKDRLSSGDSISYSNDVAAGTNKAILTLADGKKISLDEARSGLVANQSGARIVKTPDGLLLYESAGANSSSVGYNIVETPRGGNHIVVLSEGTKVWLNAASSLRYPTTFEGMNNREVEITGEAYFEVAKNSAHPFIVKSAGQQVQVLGTHFNISAYGDDASVKTTLLEGSVKISPTYSGAAAKILAPGEQAILFPGKLTVAKTDVQNDVAWKNGDFIFDDETLENILKKVSRWYDVEIEYARNVPKDIKIGGIVSRKRSLSAVLERMQKTGLVHFEVEGKKITVLP